MRYLVLLGVFLSLLTAPPLAAQADESETPHVYVFTYRKALQGQEAEYNRFVLEFSVPYYAELVKSTPLVSHRSLFLGAGSGEYTHLFISEYESWDAVDDPVAPEVLAAVCEAAFGMSCADHRAEFKPLDSIRKLVRREVLYSGG